MKNTLWSWTSSNLDAFPVVEVRTKAKVLQVDGLVFAFVCKIGHWLWRRNLEGIKWPHISKPSVWRCIFFCNGTIWDVQQFYKWSSSMKWYKGIMEGTQRKQHSCDFYYYDFSDNCFATISVCFSFEILIKVKHLLGLVCWHAQKQNKQSNHRFHASLLKWIASKKDKILQEFDLYLV